MRKEIESSITVPLGTAQLILEKASRELKLAQAALLKASARLEEANEEYSRARVNLSAVFGTVRAATLVHPLNS